eukprot:COSAG04_NODE_3343_length_2910_cov_634.524724_4_plen_116_part_01
MDPHHPRARDSLLAHDDRANVTPSVGPEEDETAATAAKTMKLRLVVGATLLLAIALSIIVKVFTKSCILQPDGACAAPPYHRGVVANVSLNSAPAEQSDEFRRVVTSNSFPALSVL